MLKKFFLSILSVLGCAFMLIGILLTEPNKSPIVAQENEGEYVGLRACSRCHSDIARTHSASTHSLTLQNVGRNKDPILAKFDDVSNVPRITFPNNPEPRPLTPDDIAYTLGAGNYLQRYLYQVGRNDYQLLPVQWNTVAQTWETFSLDEAGDWLGDSHDFGMNCAYCHTSGFDTERFRWSDDGVQCESCHGLGSEHVRLADRAGRNPSDRELRHIKEVIQSGTDAQVCGQCHSQGQSPQNHPFPIGYTAGGTLISNRTFSLVANDDSAYWWGTGNGKRTNMQYNEWETSGHAQADVSCASCHYPHAQTDQPHLLTQSPYSLCASCHHNNPPTDETSTKAPPNIEMYEGVTVVDKVVGIPSAHFSAANNAPDCLTCHMPAIPVEGFTRTSHTFAVILPEIALNVPEIIDGCTQCHQDQASSQALQALIIDIQTDTRERIAVIRAQINENSPTWITVALDFIEADGSMGVHNYAYTDALLDAIEVALGISL